MELAGILVLVVGVPVALVVGVVLLGKWEEKRRSERMLEACHRLGYAFEAVADLEALRALGDLPLYGHGHRQTVRNVLSGRSAGHAVKLFDYAYVMGSGKSAHSYAQTVLLVLDSRLPDFALQPEWALDRLGERLFGTPDLDLPDAPAFSKAYKLTGPDEAAIRAAFDAEALAFFASERWWHVEVRGGAAAVYQSQKLCRTGAVKEALEERLEVLRTLRTD